MATVKLLLLIVALVCLWTESVGAYDPAETQPGETGAPDDWRRRNGEHSGEHNGGSRDSSSEETHPGDTGAPDDRSMRKGGRHGGNRGGSHEENRGGSHEENRGGSHEENRGGSRGSSSEGQKDKDGQSGKHTGEEDEAECKTPEGCDHDGRGHHKKIPFITIIVCLVVVISAMGVGICFRKKLAQCCCKKQSSVRVTPPVYPREKMPLPWVESAGPLPEKSMPPPQYIWIEGQGKGPTVLAPLYPGADNPSAPPPMYKSTASIRTVVTDHK